MLKTYSQHGEDLIIYVLFCMMGIQYPSYLDLGAHHPYITSNTALMYQRGSRGVDVEANPDLIEIFKKERPEDIILNYGVVPSSSEDILPFFRFGKDAAINTFSDEEIKYIEERVGHVDIFDEIYIKTAQMDKIVEKYFGGHYPDFLDIDIEGMDYAVLEDSKIENNGPKIIMAEVREKQLNKFEGMLEKKGYLRYCRLWTNNIFVRKDIVKYIERTNIYDECLYKNFND